MTRSKIHVIKGGALALAMLGTVSVGWAADAGNYPTKPVHYIIPFGPGGESDITARLQQPYFKKLTGKDLVISYKPGGGGAVGWSQLNGMKGDGYNIMGVNLPHIIVKPLMGDVGFKTDDITTVYMFEYTPDAIVVRKDSQFKTLQDLIDYAKKHPGQLTFSGSGKGTANDLANTRFDKVTGTKTTYIPFKGTGAAFTALIGGQVKAEWGYSTVAANHPDDVRLLALATDKKMSLFPKVPTFKEKGIDMVDGTYRGVAVPKSTPEAMRKKVSRIVGKINADSGFQKKMKDRGFVLLSVPYSKIDAFMKKKIATYKQLGKAAGVIK